jgi:hypothetical protein
MSGVPFPMISKWAFAYHRKGLCRHLDLVRVYADSTFDQLPYASINLDHPIVLLKPEGLKERPSHVALACDLFPEPDLYTFLAAVENHIAAAQLWEIEEGQLYVLTSMERGDSPRRVIPIDYEHALGKFGGINFEPVNTSINQKETTP